MLGYDLYCKFVCPVYNVANNNEIVLSKYFVLLH